MLRCCCLPRCRHLLGALAVVADPSLTLKPARLAGSAACLNCGTGLQGPYCHYCGQPDRNFLRFFPALMRDLLEDFLDLVKTWWERGLR